MMRDARPLASLWPWLGLGAVLLIAGALAQLLLGAAGESATPAVAAVAVLAGLVCLALFGSLRRFLIFLLFFTTALDMSKAVVAPEPPFFSPGLYLTVAQAVLLVWALLWLFDHAVRQRRRLPLSGLDALALLFLAVVWLQALRSPAGGIALAGALAYSLGVLGYYVVSHALVSLADVRLALKGVVAVFVLQAVFVALQMAAHAPIVLPGIKVAGGDMMLALGDAAAFRPIGLFNHPNVMADYVLWLLLPALALVLMGRRRIAAGVWWLALAVLGVGGAMLLLSMSRGGWAAFVLGALVLGKVYWRCRLIGRRHLLAAAGLLAAALMAVALVYPQVFLRLTEPDSRSTESRVLLAEQALNIIRAEPLLGVGFGAYNRAAHDHIPSAWADVSADYQTALLQLVVHNQYLLTAAELGLPALLLWLLLLLGMAGQAWPLSQWQQPGLFALGTGLGAALIAHMLYLASDNYYVDIRIFQLWLAAGLLQALRLQARQVEPAVLVRAPGARRL
ncbi:MAG: O-antigen ligase family protein [Burkholderiales bacterium]